MTQIKSLTPSTTQPTLTTEESERTSATPAYDSGRRGILAIAMSNYQPCGCDGEVKDTFERVPLPRRYP